MSDTCCQIELTDISKLKPYSMDSEAVLKELQTEKTGLVGEKIKNRRLEFGPNKIKEKKGYSIFSLIVEQFADFLIILLMLAGVFSFFIGETIDAVAIFIIIIVNGILGFAQEFKAEKSLEALKKIETPEARVIRKGREQTVQAEEIVPGDIIVLYEGEKVPADARLLEANSLKVDESMLTGESLPVSKEAKKLDQETALADRKNMVYSGCMVTRGKGKAVVVMTGMETEVGKIADEIQSAPEEQTPLQKALEKLGKLLGMICIGIALPGFLVGIIRGKDVVEMIMMAISLAVSAIPEGLPIVVTIALALGIRRMVKVNVLIRKLSTAESLGGTDVICSDKTGTITHNQMTVNAVFLPEEGFFNITGSGYDTSGKVKLGKKENKKFSYSTKKIKEKKILGLIESSVLCSDASMDFGDPTERALVVALRKINCTEDKLKQEHPRIDEIPFSSKQKYMAVKVKNGKKEQSIVKGAPEIVMEMCELTKKEKEKYLKINEHLSAQGLRVLGVAEKNLKKEEDIKPLKEYQFKGLVGMYDPPREEVSCSLDICKRAGVRVIMITGDHKKTAEAIANRVGLETSEVITGVEIEKMSDQEFRKKVKKANVFARVSPSHKVKILRALQKEGHQVAMTGDGVNDAPAVKRADVGIAVGSGTDLTKGISDMILLDDDFSTIAKGIREGRRIFFNIKKFVKFLISANFDEILEIFTCLLFNIPLSFLPLQILWLNLATDSLPALALTKDVAEEGIMEKQPYDTKKEILHGVIPFSVLAAVIAYISTFGLYLTSLYIWNKPLDYARTMAFTTTVLFEFFLVFSIRSDKSAFKAGIFSNKLLWLSIVLGVIGQMFTLYTPIGREIFKTVALGPNDWLLVLLCASTGLTVVELIKFIKSRLPESVAKYIPTG
jgi:Ca2+-transporting ATPase